jgi:NAD(P)-dependent dehydrogenase (short-subunit alcohol dehydrogenase family)
MLKIALVTGAGSGIGRACAVALAQAGWTVVGCGRKQATLDETAAMAPGIEAQVCDVADEASVAALFAAIKERHGRLDLVFNNAGTSVLFTNFGDLTFEQWRGVMEVNVNGAFLVAHAAYRMMRDQTPRGGRIINNGSISSTMPRPGSAPYTASKHAISGLTRSIALDGRAHDIACGQIDIGNAASDMTQAMQQGVPQADGSVKAEPLMDVAHVASTVTHMASLPAEANMLFVNVMATNMPFIGRG